MAKAERSRTLGRGRELFEQGARGRGRTCPAGVTYEDVQRAKPSEVEGLASEVPLVSTLSELAREEKYSGGLGDTERYKQNITMQALLRGFVPAPPELATLNRQLADWHGQSTHDTYLLFEEIDNNVDCAHGVEVPTSYSGSRWKTTGPRDANGTHLYLLKSMKATELADMQKALTALTADERTYERTKRLLQFPMRILTACGGFWAASPNLAYGMMESFVYDLRSRGRADSRYSQGPTRPLHRWAPCSTPRPPDKKGDGSSSIKSVRCHAILYSAILVKVPSI